MKIGIVGKGRVGQAVSRRLSMDDKHEAVFVSARDESEWDSLASVEALLIAVKDDAICDVAVKVLRHTPSQLKLVAHFSGANNFDVLPSGEFVRASIHPLYPFPKDQGANIPWSEISVMISAETSNARELASEIADSLGVREHFELGSSEIALYHAMTVFASNFPVLLIGAVEELSENIGLEPSAMKQRLTPLILASVNAALSENSHDALTGPIVRNDAGTIERHLAALNADPSIAALYAAFLRFARAKEYFPPAHERGENG